MDKGEPQGTTWPLPKFYFSVDFGNGEAVAFQEVSGLDVETQPLEYRAGNSPVFSKVKMPGMVKSSNITLKRGVFTKGKGFWDWFSQVKMNTITRRTVTITLLDEGGAPTMVWTLANAFPTKITAIDLKAEGNEVAIETLELAHDGLTIANG